LTGIRIPFDDLSPDALRGVVEEFVTRDGTELTDADKKIAQVMGHLERGTMEIWFDEASRTCNLRVCEDS